MSNQSFLPTFSLSNFIPKVIILFQMKNIFLGIILTSAIVSCNQNSKANADNGKTTDINSTGNTEIKPENPTTLKIYSPEKVSELVQTKNDTLYVTNFFATWCGPCIKEIPHFVEVMHENKDKPIKFTFVNLNDKEDWKTEVESFSEEKGIKNNIILLDSETLNEDFFTKNFQKWKGDFIPFTFIRKGDKTLELGGSISKEKLNESIKSLNK